VVFDRAGPIHGSGRLLRVKNAVLLSIAFLALNGCATSQEYSADPAVAALTTAPPGGLSHVEILYGYRCKGCHEPATPGAPNRKELATFEQQEIVDALNKGSMKALAPGLSREEMRALAIFLTKTNS